MNYWCKHIYSVVITKNSFLFLFAYPFTSMLYFSRRDTIEMNRGSRASHMETLKFTRAALKIDKFPRHKLNSVESRARDGVFIPMWTRKSRTRPGLYAIRAAVRIS